MADAKVCDKCAKPIAPGLIYGGEGRPSLREIDANGMGKLILIARLVRDEEPVPDLCGVCFRQIAMLCLRDPEPSATVNHACHICGKPVDISTMTVCVACGEAH